MNTSIIKRFCDQITVGDNCWEWIGTKRLGYGRISINRKKVTCHRFSWSHFKGDIPEGMSVLHHCDNPACVRPSHLFLGTYKDNADDMVKKGRHAPVFGEHNPKAKLKVVQVKEIRRLYNIGESIESLREKFSVSWGTIQLIVKGLTWKRTD